MVPYLILLAGIMALLALSAHTRVALAGGATRGVWTYFDWLLLAMLIVFAGSRIGVGTDYTLYTSIWEKLPTHSFGAALDASPQEGGFTILQVLLKRIDSDPQILFWATAALSVVPVIAVIKRESVEPALSVILFVTLGSYLLPLNVVRQGLAASLIFYAATTWLDSRRSRYVLACAVAAAIHVTALIPAIALFVARKWRPTMHTAILIVGIALVAGLGLRSVDAISDVVGLLNPRYVQYIAGAETTGFGTLLTIAAKLVLLTYCYRNVSAMDELSRRWLMFSTLGIPCLVLGSLSVEYARLDIYFSIFLILAVPAAVHAAGARIDRLILTSASVVYMVVLLQNFGELIGYRSTLVG